MDILSLRLFELFSNTIPSPPTTRRGAGGAADAHFVREPLDSVKKPFQPRRLLASQRKILPIGPTPSGGLIFTGQSV